MKRLILALLLTACALAQIPENPTGPNPAGGGVGGASALTGSNALLKDAAAGTAGVSVLFDSGAFFGNTAARTIGWGIYNRTGNISPGTTRYALWNGSLVVGDPATLGSESLADGTFTIPTWTRTGDFTVNTGAAVYTHSAGSGTFTQLNASMAIALAGGKWYSLVGDIATTGTAPACILTSATADTSGGLLAGLRTAAGTTVELLQFKAAAVPTGFVGSCTSTVAGTVAYDNLVLKEVVGGDLMLSGSLYARGATIYGGSSPGNVLLTVRGGIGQTANLQNWTNPAGTVTGYISYLGGLTASGITSVTYPIQGASTQAIGWTGRANLYSSAAGIVGIGGLTNAFAGIKRSGTAIQIRLADDSAYGSLHTRSVNYTAQTECGCGTQTDFVIDAADNTKVTSASYTFVAADVGGIFQVTGGTSWAVGDHTITSVAAGAATLATSPGAVGLTGGTANYGRGRMMMVQGAAGVADTIRICGKATTNVYAWYAMATIL